MWMNVCVWCNKSIERCDEAQDEKGEYYHKHCLHAKEEIDQLFKNLEEKENHFLAFKRVMQEL
jgi:hypothetical protein